MERRFDEQLHALNSIDVNRKHYNRNNYRGTLINYRIQVVLKDYLVEAITETLINYRMEVVLKDYLVEGITETLINYRMEVILLDQIIRCFNCNGENHNSRNCLSKNEERHLQVEVTALSDL